MPKQNSYISEASDQLQHHDTFYKQTKN